MEERLKRQLDFALEIDKEKNIFRQTHLSGHGLNENEDRKSTRLNSSHMPKSRMPSSA